MESEAAAAIYSRAVQFGLVSAEEQRQVEAETRCQFEESEFLANDVTEPLGGGHSMKSATGEAARLCERPYA